MTAPGGATTIGYAALQLIPSLDGFSAAVDKQLGGTLKVVGQRGGRSMGSGLAAGLKASEADVKRALDNHAKLADKAADATGRLKVAQAGYDELVEKGVTTGKRYAAAVAAKERAARDEARAIKTATDALKEYEDAAKSAGEKASTGILSSLRGAASGAGSAGSDAAAGFAEGFAGSSALLRLGSVGGPVGIAVAAAGTVIGGLLWKNIEAGIDREPGRDLIQARLGASGAEIANLAKASGAAYANNFGESLQSNLQAAQLAVQGGLVANAMDPALQSTTEKLQAISSLVGGDLTETVKSVSILMKSGMAQSADEAFDIIAKGYQVTGDLGADWLDSIGEYSSGWKNAGFTAEQALALIKQAQDNGVDVTDRSADALREFGRRVSEEGPKMVAILDAIGFNGQAMYDKFKQGGPAAFDAFDQVFDKIRSIQDPVDRNQVALALLGDTAGDFIDAFAKWDPSAAVDSLGSVQGAAQNASNTMGNNVVGTFESARRSIEVAVGGVQDKLADAFGPKLQEVANWVKEHSSDIENFFVGMADIAVGVGAEILDTVGGITEAMGQLVGGIGNVQGTVLKFEAWQADIRGDGQLANELRRQSEEAYGWGDSLEAAGTSMRNAADDLKKWKQDLRDGTTDTEDADTAVGGLGKSVDDLGDSVRKLPADLPPWMKDLASGTGGAPAGQNPLTAPLGPGTVTSPGAAPVIPGLSPTGGGGRGVGINLQASKLPQGGSPTIAPGSSREQVIAGLAARARAEGLSEAEVAGVLALAQTESNFDETGFLGFSTKTVDTGYTGGAAYANDFNKAMDQFFTNYKKGGLAAGGGADVLASAQAELARGNAEPFLNWLQNGLQGAVSGQGGMNQEFGPNIRKFFGQWFGNAPATSGAVTAAPGGAYGLPAGTDTGGYGTGSSKTFPSWVMALADQFGIKPSTYAGHQESDRNEAGYAPNPNHENRGIDWSGPVENMQRFADYLATVPGALEQVIFENPSTGRTTTIAGGKPVTGYYDAGTLADHQNHVHTRQSGPIPLPGGAVNASLASNTTQVTGPVSPDLINAYGAGYKPGIGTPGYNEYGEPGYYETDPRRIAQAQRSADDAVDRIADADQAVTDSNNALAEAVKERDAVAQLSEVQRIAQGKDLDKANADVDRLQKQVDRATKEADRSREDADWAQQDLAEAQQGSFKSAQKESGSSRSGKGLSLSSTFSGFGSAIGEFAGGQIGSALDVFGIGDSPPFLQAAQQLLGGISITDAAGNSLFDGGNMFAGASPLAAAGAGGAAVADGTQHGSLGGQAPGPVYNTTIQARDAEDAMDKWQRLQNQRMAAKTSVY